MVYVRGSFYTTITVCSACKLMAKQKVALECLSYHATASPEQTIQLAKAPIRSAEDYKLYSFKFIGELKRSFITVVLTTHI